MKTPPELVIGLPVHNGANYLQPAIDSILGQSFSDFRLLIADNASTDDTEEICRGYAGGDSRVAYFRHPRNIGVAPNFNSAYKPDGAPFFKWAAHDDVLEPTYLERCIELMRENRDLAVAHSGSFQINAEGVRTRPYDLDIRLNGPRPRERLWRILWVRHFTEGYGVMRSELIDKTHLHGSYVGSDRNFMAEVLLLGDIGYADDYLFNRREHPGSYMGGVVLGKRSRVMWFDSDAKVPILPVGLINLREHIRSVLTLPLPRYERVACLQVVLEWGVRRALEVIMKKGDRHREDVARQIVPNCDSTALSERADHC